MRQATVAALPPPSDPHISYGSRVPTRGYESLPHAPYEPSLSERLGGSQTHSRWTQARYGGYSLGQWAGGGAVIGGLGMVAAGALVGGLGGTADSRAQSRQ